MLCSAYVRLRLLDPSIINEVLLEPKKKVFLKCAHCNFRKSERGHDQRPGHDDDAAVCSSDRDSTAAHLLGCGRRSSRPQGNACGPVFRLQCRLSRRSRSAAQRSAAHTGSPEYSGMAWRGGMHCTGGGRSQGRQPFVPRLPGASQAESDETKVHRSAGPSSDCNRRSYLCRARLTCFCLHLSHFPRAPITAQFLAS